MKKRMLSVLVAIMVLFCVVPSCFAEEKSQDTPLQVVLTSDKAEYKKGEAITSTLTVTNTNDVAVPNVSLENVAIEGYEIVEGSQGTKVIERLQPGESVSLETTFKASGSEAVKTGIQNNGEKVLIAAALLLLCVALFYYLVKNHKGKRVFSILLGFAIVGSGMMMMSDSPSAAEALSKIEVSTKITVEQREVELKGVVSYRGRVTKIENEETLTIGDILPDDYPTSLDGAWKTGTGNFSYITNSEDDKSLTFYNSSEGSTTWFSLSNPVLKSGENYTYGSSITFIMSGDKLVKIDFHSDSFLLYEFNGIYMPPNIVTIGDILPDDYPTSLDGAWKTGTGNFSYITNSEDDKSLTFYNFSGGSSSNYSLSCLVFKSGENYETSDYDMTFIMSGDKLVKIDFHSDSFGLYEFNGIYMPPNIVTIGDILPDDFPFSDDQWSIPQNAWKAGDNQFCYKTSDKLCFYAYGDGVENYQSVRAFPFSDGVTQSGENYVYSFLGTVTFIMSEGKLASIEVADSGDFNGVYSPPQNNDEKTLTIADILPDDYPTTQDKAWVTETGNFSYIDDEDDQIIMFYDPTEHGTGFDLSHSVTKSGENYNIGSKVTFIMSGDKLEKIDVNVTDISPHDYNGVYYPPQN